MTFSSLIEQHPLNRVPADPDEDFAPAGYSLAYDDDFTTFTADETANGGTTWRTTYPDGSRSTFATRQIYTDADYTGTGGTPLGMDPFEQVVGGGLKINMSLTTTEQKASLPNQSATGLPPDYWSGTLASDAFLVPVTGYWAIRARLPDATTGEFPAAWLVDAFGADYEEIDFLEHVDADGTNHTAFHTEAAQLVRARPRIIKNSWNVCAARRTAEGVQWSINGIPTARLTRAPLFALPTIINFAVNSSNIGNHGLLPFAYEIDWFRFYEPPLNWTGTGTVLDGIPGAVSEWDGENSSKTGDPVTQWNDLIGANHATHDTGTAPSLGTIGGRAVLDFTSGHLDAGAIALPAPSAGGATMMCVAQPDVSNAFMMPIGYGTTSATGVQGVSIAFTSSATIRGSISDSASRVTKEFGSYAANVPIILQLAYDASHIKVKINNGPPQRQTHSLENNISGLPLGLGRSGSSTAWGLNGKLMWAGYCTGLLSDMHMETVARRLNARFTVY